MSPRICSAWSLANLARRRDGVGLGPPAGQPLAEWLANYNAEWLAACRRLSYRVLVDHLELAASAFEDYVAGLDIDQMGQPVAWAGPEPAPVWLDVAREYTERWVHQQQIREAVGSPRIRPEQAKVVIATFVHALPVALTPTPAGEGATVAFTVTGQGGGAWRLTHRAGRWHLEPGSPPDPTASISTTIDGAWRLFTQHPHTPPPTLAGDPALTDAICAATAIIR